jgi:hypothetical protein
MPSVRLLKAAIAAACLLAFAAPPAAARLLIAIDKSAQRMTVSLDGEPIHHWPVSTGLRAYDTPSGAYTPFRMAEHHFSREWDDAPMPHSIFFTKRGHAIHGTTHLRDIGRPASHGCVRLEPQNARVLFGLVRRIGLPNTRVVLAGMTPAVTTPAVARRAPDYLEPHTGYGEPRPYGQRPLEAQDSHRQRLNPADRPPYPYETQSPELRPQQSWPEPSRPHAPRTGYWLIRPDGSRVFVDRERDLRPPPPPPPPPPPFFFGRPGWD